MITRTIPIIGFLILSRSMGAESDIKPWRGLWPERTAPPGWVHAGNARGDYEMFCDTTVVHGGKKSATVKCIAAEPTGFGTLMQTIRADNYRGKRVRLSGYIRTRDVTGFSTFWLRMDRSEDKKVLAFDSMQSRAPIKGMTDWTRYALVLDVPESCDMINFGLILNGGGQTWMDDLKFEIVGHDVPVTAEPFEHDLSTKPKLDVP